MLSVFSDNHVEVLQRKKKKKKKKPKNLFGRGKELEE